MSSDEERIKFNRRENERYFIAITQGMAVKTRADFQMRLLDGLFSVVEADDFKRMCLKIVANFGGVTLQ